MNLAEVRKLIRQENPQAKADDIEMYAQQFVSYFEAAVNIQANGTIVSHPRTGQPMDNPYVKIRAGAQQCMTKIRRLKVNELWSIAASELESHATENQDR